jgi:hypothetical protein
LVALWFIELPADAAAAGKYSIPQGMQLMFSKAVMIRLRSSFKSS